MNKVPVCSINKESAFSQDEKGVLKREAIINFDGKCSFDLNDPLRVQ